MALLSPAELRDRYPWLAVDDLAGGSLGLSGEGSFDGYGLLRALRAKAIAQGARYLRGEATGLEIAAGRVAAVRLADGSRLPCDAAVNAAGPWAAAVAAMAGIDLPVRARARTVFVLTCPEPLPGCPLVIDPSGVWFRPEGDGLPRRRAAPGRGPRRPPLEPDHGAVRGRSSGRRWPQRVPAFERLRVRGAWAGYYEMNLFDQNGIVGPHPDVPNLYFASGFSGHGIQQAPAVGRGLAELIRPRPLPHARPLAARLAAAARRPAARRAQRDLTQMKEHGAMAETPKHLVRTRELDPKRRLSDPTPPQPGRRDPRAVLERAHRHAATGGEPRARAAWQGELHRARPHARTRSSSSSSKVRARP